MDKTYSTHTLFNCYLKDVGESGNAITLSNANLEQSLELLSTVLNSLKTMSNQTKKAKDYLQNFERIERYQGKLPNIMDDYWSIEEMTILIIMLSSSSRKRYNSMNKTIEKLNDESLIPTEKVLKSNRDWLLEAYNCLELLKHRNWAKEIKEEILNQTLKGKMTIADSYENVMEVEAGIIESGVLNAEWNSEIGDILANCAYPELLKKSIKTPADQIIEVLSEFMLALEKVEGSSSQYIAMNEATKRMRQLTEKIEHSYDVSKCYSDAYWENVRNDGQDKETLLEMNKFLKETFQVEHDILKKNTH